VGGDAGASTDRRLSELVGQRVRLLRTRAGVGLREQARALNMSASSLSALENARGGISLKRLQQVADHFGLPLTDLLADGSDGGGGAASIEVIRDVATVPGVARGRGVVYQLLGASHGHAIQAYLLAFEPGGGYEDDMISHPGEEFCYVVHGRVELLFGVDTHVLGQGDSARFRTEVPHAFRNASEDGMALVIGAATPPW
jgi:transcriptional regulator with XRE-family HTH domain/mannose-6-phosphate isomerase-like protein (cupin superfamily)